MPERKASVSPARGVFIYLLVSLWLGYSGALLGWWAYTSPSGDICFSPRS